jgi:hypothetical protein
MNSCVEYWKKRAELAETIMNENQIGAWKNWKDYPKAPPEVDKQKFIDYIHEFAWEFGRLWNTELTPEQKIERIKERIKSPDEFVEDNF